jgi:hypothetical protein
MRFAQAFVSASGAAAAVTCDTEFAAQILQRAGTALGGFANLPIGDSLADTYVHERSPLVAIMRTVLILFKCE